MSSKTQSKSVEKTDFGIRLKEAFKNISNQAIADKIGVGKSTLTAYMQGRIPPPNKLLEIEKETQCNLTWLLTGKGSPRAQNSTRRPQGIILQGSKGGIGTSTCAVFIAANLALRGHGVLLADDTSNSCLNLLFSLKGEVKYIPLGFDEPWENDYYISTNVKNFDLFVPRIINQFEISKEMMKPFKFDSLQMSEKYDFVIFDIQKAGDPFYYPNLFQQRNFPLEPILRQAKVITPYNILESHRDSIRSTIKYVEKQKSIYPEADFSGMFFTKHKPIHKSQHHDYAINLTSLENEFSSKIFQSQIEFNPQLSKSTKEIQKIIFSRKTKIYDDFSKLVDELLIRINYEPK